MRRGRTLLSESSSPIGQSYVGLLGAQLVEYLHSLGPNEQILDVGSGEGRAIFQWLKISQNSRGWVPPTVVIEKDPPSEYFRQLHAAENKQLVARHRTLSGRDYLEILNSEIGTSAAVLDVFGAYAYSNRPMDVLQKHLLSLKVGGKAFIVSGKNTVFLNGQGQLINPWAFFYRFKGVRVIELTPLTLILERTAEPLVVPSVTTRITEEGFPPHREITINEFMNQ